MRAERLRFDQRGRIVLDDGAVREETAAEFAAHLAKRQIPDPTIYREPDEQMSLRFAIEAMGDTIRRRYECRLQLQCGGECCRSIGHAPPCLCGGDENGVPGTCPA